MSGAIASVLKSGGFATARHSRKVLALSPFASDRLWLRYIFRKHRVILFEAESWRDGAEGLASHRPEVVICEAVLPDGDWKLVLKRISQLSDAPRLIVISSNADESLWVEVLNLGGYDLLSKPLVEEEVLRMVGLL